MMKIEKSQGKMAFQSFCLYYIMSIRQIDSKQYLEDEQLNLLDLVLPATTADTNIHTFVEFKEWMNSSFKPKTQLNSVSYISKNDMVFRSLKVRPSKSLVTDHSSDQFLLGSVKRRPSVNYQGLGLIEEGKEGMESSNQMMQSKQSPRKASKNIDWGFQLNENSIAGSKSAHSSRSFNGYEQINQYELKQRLGKGSFAEVFLAIDTTSTTDQKYAVKVLDSKQIKKKFLLKKSSQAIDKIESQEMEGQLTEKREKQSLATIFMRNEVAILKKMNHQYITKLFDVIIDKQKSKIYLVLQYCGGGFINESKAEKGRYRKLLESECKRFYRQLGLAMDYIHNVAKIAHRDLKPENLLINNFGEVKISDFGLGTHKMKGKKQSGTPVYMPPQSFTNEGESYSQPGDIWALGVTLLVLLTGKHPQFINQRIDVQKEVSSLKDISENCKLFISRCLQSDPEKRLKASEILEQPWLAGNESESFSNLRAPTQNYQIQVSPADELNVFKDIEKKMAINIFKLSVD